MGNRRFGVVRGRTAALTDPAVLPPAVTGGNETVEERIVRAAAHTVELERSNEALSCVAAVLAHDLASTLMGIDYLAGEVADTLPDDTPEPAREHVRRLRAEVTRGMAMVRGIRDSAAAGHQTARTPVALEPLVRSAAVTLGPAMGGAHLAIGHLPTVPGEPGALGELFQNLLANAAKYTRPGVPARITVAAERTGHGWDVAVADNGTGITAADTGRIFIMGTRGGTTTEPGSGIGLAVCARIAAAHGGTLRVHPNRTHGSVFTVHLPGLTNAVALQPAA